MMWSESEHWSEHTAAGFEMLRQIQAMLFLLHTTMISAASVASSATQACIAELSSSECEAFKDANPGFVDGNGQGVGNGAWTFGVSDGHVPYGCQWYVDPLMTASNRFLFNSANANDKSSNNEANTLSALCADSSHWCYQSYSYRVCPTESATLLCITELSATECLAFKNANPNFVDQNGQGVGTVNTFAVTDGYISYGCQWFATSDPNSNQYNRFLFNSGNAADKSCNNEANQPNGHCAGGNDPSYSYRVCGSAYLRPLPSAPPSPPLPSPPP